MRQASVYDIKINFARPFFSGDHVFAEPATNFQTSAVTKESSLYISRMELVGDD